MKKTLNTLFLYLKSMGARFLALLTRRFGLKLLSLLLALLLWGYLVSTNTSLTRVKHVEDLSVSYSSAEFLSSYGLALATDVKAEYTACIDVNVELPQSRYSQLSARNIIITPDYSAIRSAGIYDVPLVATSTYGVIKSISPSTISVTVENMDSRDLTLEVQYSGASTDTLWYHVDTSLINPQQVTISGPASLIQTVDSAVLTLDVSGHNSTYRRSAIVRLKDVDGNIITSSLLSKSSSTCAVTVDIYPKKVLEVSVDESQISVAEGYEITGISFQPATVTVAGESELIESLEYLPLELSSASSPASTSYTTRLNVSGLDDFAYISARSVYMSVSIAEQQLTRTLTGIPVTVRAADGNLEYAASACDVTVTGPISAVTALTADSIQAVAELTDAAPGTHVLVPTVSLLVSDAENLSCTVTEISVEVTEKENSND